MIKTHLIKNQYLSGKTSLDFYCGHYVHKNNYTANYVKKFPEIKIPPSWACKSCWRAAIAEGKNGVV